MNKRVVTFALGLAVVGMLLPFATTSLSARQSQGGDVSIQLNSCNPAFDYGASGAFRVCLSAEGNVVVFGTSTVDHINLEGYRICTPTTSYFDNAFGSSGFGPPTITQPNGPNTFPLTIKRLTTDGQFQLSQAYTRDGTEQELIIAMTVKKLASPIGSGVFLTRWADVNAGGLTSNFGDNSADALWFREPHTAALGRGVMLTTYTKGTAHTTNMGPLGTGSGNCVQVSNGPVGFTDISGAINFNLAGFNKNQTKTVKVSYQMR